MPTVNFSEYDEVGTIKAGRYLAQVLEVDDSRRTKNEDEMWTLHFRLLDGPEGAPYPQGSLDKRAMTDNLVWSEGAMRRAKLICRCFGINVDSDSEVEVTAEMIRGKPVYLDIVEDEFERRDGSKGKRNIVTFEGYHPVPDDLAAAVETDGSADDIPF